MKNIGALGGRWRLILASDGFFKFVVIVLVIQAAWIALTSHYPMAFDEDFHFGLIKLYADHINPFWSAHPSAADPFGAVTRDPSYMFHYLMSFPYRLIRLVTSNLAAQVLILRAINISLMAAGLWLYRRLLMGTGASRAVVNFCLLIFVLVPIVPLLAAHINYDNLSLPLTALAMLLALKFTDSLRQERINLAALLQLLATCLLGSLVKYTFLPVFATITAYVIIRYLQAHRSLNFRKEIKAVWQASSRLVLCGLIGAIIILGALFIERYGVNIARYHEPVSDCAKVLSYDHCKSYGPWIRDYNFAQAHPEVNKNPVLYTRHWFYAMWFRSFFAVDGPLTLYETRGPLTLPALGMVVFALMAVVGLLLQGRRLLKIYKKEVLLFFMAVIAIHSLAIWQTVYKLYLDTGQPVAINGRYLLPILPLVLLLSIISVKELLRPWMRLQAVLAAVVVICLLWGGGGLTYILRSNDAWYWPWTPLKAPNHAIQRVLGPVTPGYNRPIQYLRP